MNSLNQTSIKNYSYNHSEPLHSLIFNNQGVNFNFEHMGFEVPSLVPVNIILLPLLEYVKIIEVISFEKMTKYPL